MKFSPPLTTLEVSHSFCGKFNTVENIPSGEGGQGVVFKVEIAGVVQALKIYYPGSTTDRTQREVAALRKIKCSTLVSLIDSGEIDVRGEICVYVITNFIDGICLSDVAWKYNPKFCAQIGADISHAIEAVWQERIVHRDIKPQNIMIRRDFSAVMIDLGVARHLSMSSITTMGKTWGTEGYMSPEQCRAMRQLSCKSDIFALGVVLQELLLGRHPYGRNQNLMIRGGLETKKLGLKIDPDFESILDRMLLRDAHLRPSPKEIYTTLRKLNMT